MLKTEGEMSGGNGTDTPIGFATEGLLFIIGCSDGLDNVTVNVRSLAVKISKYTHIKEQITTHV